MGLLRDTYIINDNEGVRTELKTANHIAREQLDFEKSKFEQELATKDRVDISLNEYETLRNDLKETKELLNKYQSFIQDLGKSIRQNPEILLNSKVVKSELEKTPLIDGYNLYVIWEIQNKDLL